MEIANPMYDAVFEFLMADNEAAKALIAGLTGLTITQLTPLKGSPTEEGKARKQIRERRFSILEFDYVVTIEEEGVEKTMILEFQRMKDFKTEKLFFISKLWPLEEDGGESPRGLPALCLLSII